MPIKEATLKKAQDFKAAIQIGAQIMAASKTFDEEAKKAFKKHDSWNLEILDEAVTNGKLSSAELKSLTDSYFILWNEGIGLDMEAFWHQLQSKSIDFTRKDPVRSALLKGRFQSVHQAMAARKDWETLKNSNLLKSRLSPAEMDGFEELIQKDESTRVDLLKKCLNKKKIPKSQYLRFGDSMAYMEHCDLFERYFTQNEYDELHAIWNNFSF